MFEYLSVDVLNLAKELVVPSLFLIGIALFPIKKRYKGTTTKIKSDGTTEEEKTTIKWTGKSPYSNH